MKINEKILDSLIINLNTQLNSSSINYSLTKRIIRTAIYIFDKRFNNEIEVPEKLAQIQVCVKWLKTAENLKKRKILDKLLLEKIKILIKKIKNRHLKLEKQCVHLVRLPISFGNIIQKYEHKQNQLLNFKLKDNLYGKKIQKILFHLTATHSEDSEIGNLNLDGATVYKIAYSFFKMINLFSIKGHYFLSNFSFISKFYFDCAFKIEYFSKFQTDSCFLESYRDFISHQKNQKIDNEELDEFKKLQKHSNLEEYTLSSSICSNSVIWEIIDHLNRLEFNEFLWVPAGTTEHSIVLEIEKKLTGFTLRLFNAGYGLNYHVYDLPIHEEKIRPLVIENIFLEQLSYAFFEKIFSKFCLSQNIGSLYIYFAQHLLGLDNLPTFWPTPLELQFIDNFYEPQKNGTCTYASLEMALFYHLNEEEKLCFLEKKLAFASKLQQTVTHIQNKKLDSHLDLKKKYQSFDFKNMNQVMVKFIEQQKQDIQNKIVNFSTKPAFDFSEVLAEESA